MADDLTDALRAIIEPMREELISVAQAHYLARIREELADAHRHAERAMALIGDLIPEDTEPHWEVPGGPGALNAWARRMAAQVPEYGKRVPGSPPLQPKTITRHTPKPGELWRFATLARTTEPEYMVAEVQDTDPTSPARHAVIPDGKFAGHGFRFDRNDDPRPVELLRNAD